MDKKENEMDFQREFDLKANNALQAEYTLIEELDSLVKNAILDLQVARNHRGEESRQAAFALVEISHSTLHSRLTLRLKSLVAQMQDIGTRLRVSEPPVDLPRLDEK
jgi:hypothetical protein